MQPTIYYSIFTKQLHDRSLVGFFFFNFVMSQNMPNASSSLLKDNFAFKFFLKEYHG